MDAGYQMIVITLTAVFGIAILKFLMVKFPIPGLSNLVKSV